VLVWVAVYVHGAVKVCVGDESMEVGSEVSVSVSAMEGVRLVEDAEVGYEVEFEVDVVVDVAAGPSKSPPDEELDECR